MRIFSGKVYQIGKWRYRIDFWHLSRTYEFTGIYDGEGNVGAYHGKYIAEDIVNEALTKGQIKEI